MVRSDVKWTLGIPLTPVGGHHVKDSPQHAQTQLLQLYVTPATPGRRDGFLFSKNFRRQHSVIECHPAHGVQNSMLDHPPGAHRSRRRLMDRVSHGEEDVPEVRRQIGVQCRVQVLLAVWLGHGVAVPVVCTWSDPRHQIILLEVLYQRVAAVEESQAQASRAIGCQFLEIDVCIAHGLPSIPLELVLGVQQTPYSTRNDIDALFCRIQGVFHEHLHE